VIKNFNVVFFVCPRNFWIRGTFISLEMR